MSINLYTILTRCWAYWPAGYSLIYVCLNWIKIFRFKWRLGKTAYGKRWSTYDAGF